VEDRERKAIHSRWSQQLNRRSDDPGYRQEWAFEQCGGCLHWLSVAGQIGDDWGVCSSASSSFDGEVRFEHDGCDEFTEDPDGFGLTRG